MFCTNPNYFSGHGFAPCGKCQGCRIAKKKEWSDRLQIESRYHQFNYFVTLTYAEEHYPEDGCVSRDDLKLYCKRLAYYCGSMPQYFACGEYGSESARAHYHLAIFADADIFNYIMAAWDKGRISVEHLTPGRCKYICGYVVKKMTRPDDVRLDGKTPEFFSNSRRPALGYTFFYDLLERFVTDDTFRKNMLSYAYPPYSINMAGKKIMLPRYVRDKLRFLYDENEEARVAVNTEKKTEDAAIFAKIAQNVQRMCLDQGLLGDYEVLNKFVRQDKLKELRKDRESKFIKSYNLRNRRKL